VRRQALAEVVRRHQLLVIEDDVYGALTDSPPLYPLLEGRGILISSLSKTVAAGLRLGWIAARPGLLEQIDPHAQATHWPVSPLNLHIACQWIADGTAARRLAWQRQEIGERWRLARAILGDHLVAGAVPSPHAWVATPGDAETLVGAAARRVSRWSRRVCSRSEPRRCRRCASACRRHLAAPS
jgi:DNA-binding transcriptional MocR family regulator